jgi:hypothetical protein
MNSSKLAVIVLVALAAETSTRAFGAGKPPPQPTFQPKVQAVGSDSITVTEGAHAGLKQYKTDSDGGRTTTDAAVNVHTYKVTQFTAITVDDLKTDLKAVKPGMLVIVVHGVDPGVASSIVAHTVPPAPPKPTPNPKVKATPAPAQGKGKGTTTKPAFRPITEDQILSVSADTVTVGQLGQKKAKAYRIGSSTTITVNGSKSDLSGLSVGMKVRVTAQDQTTASTIDAHNAK